MMIQEFREEYISAIERAVITPPGNTHLYRLAEECMEMIHAYADDGRAFFRSGDPVNAHAAYTYGLGWLDAGSALGFFGGRVPMATLPVFNEEISLDLKGHLEEKTERYCEMLKAASAAVSPVPDAGSPMAAAAGDISVHGERSLKKGQLWLSQGAFLNALAEFSYGYGWLDTGVRAGLFRITGDRELFTI